MPSSIGLAERVWQKKSTKMGKIQINPEGAPKSLQMVIAVRILSAVRESILWILKLFSERQGQNELRESGSLCPYVRYAASHTEVSL